MGLDGVELIMAIEEEFGILISDAEAANFVTPRLLIDHLMTKVENAGRNVCRSHRAFCLTRRVLMNQYNVPRRALSLQTPIGDLIPRAQEKIFWSGLRKVVAAKRWPNLEFSRSVQLILGGVFMGTFSLPAFALWGYLGTAALLIATFAAAITTLLTMRFLAPQRKYIPNRYRSVRELSLLLVASIDEGRWIRSEVAHVVQRIIIEQLAISPKIYHEDAEFIRDFGVG